MDMLDEDENFGVIGGHYVLSSFPSHNFINIVLKFDFSCGLLYLFG